ncbi:MAG: FAD-dependent oxidoreductase, partial [Muribaculaceae bacterium]|nr:FAD-dependent oxidoreductase [Muribaculaceae bacterium]
MDLIIIGAGPGGYELAADARRKGLEVAIIERDKLGGTCLNRGCIPTKALLASASIAHDARAAVDFGIDIAGVTPCYCRAVERKDNIVSQLREGVAMALDGVSVIQGEARFVAPDTIEVNGERYSAPRIVVATGSAPARLPIPGSEYAITSDELLELKELPARVAIIGGGVIGMEFACILHEFGVEVSVIEYCKEILLPFDRDIAKRLRTALSRRGINIIVGAAVTSISQGSVTFEHKNKNVMLDTDLVVMAVGRRPVVPEGLAELGVEIT